MLSLFLPMFAHVLLCTVLYALLTVARAPAVWGAGVNVPAVAALANRKALISANLSNQFEWPLFFHVVCLIALFAPVSNESAMVILAWIFVGGRVLHSVVQIAMNNVRVRGVIFTINFIAVIAMWVIYASILLGT